MPAEASDIFAVGSLFTGFTIRKPVLRVICASSTIRVRLTNGNVYAREALNFFIFVSDICTVVQIYVWYDW